MNEEAIVEDIIKMIGDIDGATIIKAADFTDDRTPLMIVVGIETIEGLHFALDDYKYTGTILIDSMSDQDINGDNLKAVKNAVFNKVHVVEDDKEAIASAFADLNRIVYFHIKNINFLVTERTNQAILNFEVIGSFN